MPDTTVNEVDHRYHKHLRYLAAVLVEWRYKEGLTRSEMADQIGIRDGRLRDAILAKDWNPSLRDIAKIEAAMGRKTFVTLRNADR